MEAAPGEQGRSTYPTSHVVINKSFHHPTKNLEGALVIEPGEASTQTRTTGREIGLHQGCSGAGTVTDHVTAMIATAPGAVANRSK